MKVSARVKVAFYVVLLAVFASDFFITREHPVFPWDRIPGFSAVYGFISCVVIAMLSKFIGHHGIMKKEDYYD